MSSPALMAALAARAMYAAAGHVHVGLLEIVPISGRDAPNVIDFEKYRAGKQEGATDDRHVLP